MAALIFAVVQANLVCLAAALLIQLCKCNPRRVKPFELGKSENRVCIHAFPAGAGNTRAESLRRAKILDCISSGIGDEKYETHTHALRFVADIVGSALVRPKTNGLGQ
jgi:hypothetical protein